MFFECTELKTHENPKNLKTSLSYIYSMHHTLLNLMKTWNLINQKASLTSIQPKFIEPAELHKTMKTPKTQKPALPQFNQSSLSLLNFVKPWNPHNPKNQLSL